jgi:hypothetical protein
VSGANANTRVSKVEWGEVAGWGMRVDVIEFLVVCASAGSVDEMPSDV